jgi:hypothetical protein
MTNLNEKVNKPVITIAHILTTLGLFGGVLVYANDTENKVVQTTAQQQAIIKNQDELKKDFRDYQVQQQQIQMQQMQLLHEIKGKLEK